MERPHVRYEVLQGEEEHVAAQPVELAMVVPPPAYEDVSGTAQDGADSAASQPVNEADLMYGTKLPSYDEATTLPSYDEAERSKEEEETRRQQDYESQHDDLHDRFTGLTVGTDGIFLCTFIISFLFNWIGFLLSLCLSNTVAGRCGALSGLGLSMVKWVAIFKHNDWASGFAEGDSWIWWLLMLCGFMICIRGAVQYVRVKYEWIKFTGHVRRFYM